jgi:hypothetical protein
VQVGSVRPGCKGRAGFDLALGAHAQKPALVDPADGAAAAPMLTRSAWQGQAQAVDSPRGHRRRGP